MKKSILSLLFIFITGCSNYGTEHETARKHDTSFDSLSDMQKKYLKPSDSQNIYNPITIYDYDEKNGLFKNPPNDKRKALPNSKYNQKSEKLFEF
ncbi:hypothetical protein K7H99_21410 (plasmid) [Providencia rettgeri]|uniref:hypothetical protein n=1 Tax=Providencia rettgeri TaxID=587 RepID=UPI001CA75047|nr:hypothetical protein [Providencia rettgeri]QZY66547.1 hypothetical protein K7H99_21410 [Providencia rettgeri]